MAPLKRLKHRYQIALISLIIAIPAILCLAWSGELKTIPPLSAAPIAVLNVIRGPVNQTEQPDLIRWTEQSVSSSLDSLFTRGALSFNKENVQPIVDLTAFADELASHEIALDADPGEFTNIELASKAIDGVIVHPGETFSFNNAVGRRTEDRGFQPGLMFMNGVVVMGTGGGVCITSTCLYNAALKAGLKIISRAHHSGPVRYAAPGFDAAVVYGCLDLQFKNDTASPVMIESRIDNQKLIVRIMGKKKPGFDVELLSEDYKELPYKVIEKEDETIPEGTVEVEVQARLGYEVTAVRLFKQDGKVTKREVLDHDCIEPRDKIVLIPPKPKDQPLTENKVAKIEKPSNEPMTTESSPSIEVELNKKSD